MRIPFSTSTYERETAKGPLLELINRFGETGPNGEWIWLPRPGVTSLATAGAGPIRGISRRVDVFNDAAVVVSGTALYLVQTNGTVSSSYGSIPTGSQQIGGADSFVAMDIGIGAGGLGEAMIANYDDLFRFDGGTGSFATVTISNASPGVVTHTAHNFGDGTPVVFTTSGGLPTGLTAGVTYYVKNRTADTYEVAATVGGASINTSSAGSGTHTATYPGLTVEYLPDGAGCVSVAYLNGFWFAAAPASAKIYYKLPGTAEWLALDFVSAERRPDRVSALRVVNDQLWALGPDGIEILALTGNSSPAIRPVSGLFFDKGCRAAMSAVNLDNTLVWVWEDNSGRLSVLKGGDVPSVVSTPAIEGRLAETASPRLISAYRLGWDGHDFYVLLVPAVGTFAYDATTGKWSEWKTAGISGFIGQVGFSAPGLDPVVGGHDDGKLYVLGGADDDGEDILRQVYAYVPVLHSERGRCPTVRLLTTTGADDGSATLATSDDEGETFTSRGAVTWDAGNYGQRIEWRRLGMLKQPGRVFRVSDSTTERFSGLDIA